MNGHYQYYSNALLCSILEILETLCLAPLSHIGKGANDVQLTATGRLLS